MDIEVNTQVGKLVNDALYTQFAAAGHHFPQLPVCPLWEVLAAIAKIAGPRNTDKEIQHFLLEAPHGTYLWLVESAMAISARINPNDAASAVGMVPVLQEKLAHHNCAPLTTTECDTLVAALEPLIAHPRQPDVMGVLGATLFNQLTCNLPEVTNRQDRRRRESFLVSGEKACRNIEQEPNRADCRSRASVLAEQLDKELRLSGSSKRRWAVGCFWVTVDLINVRL